MNELESMSTQRHDTTRNTVLNVAERLFAEHGFEKTTHRMITAAAHANLGAVNYHFNTKDDLILAVLKRRMRPINAERAALLEKLEEEAKGRPVPVPRILEALFRPTVDALTTPKKGGRHFLRLMSLLLAEPGAHLLPVIKEEFADTTQRFHAALRRSLPGATDVDIYWKLHFAMGAFVHAVSQARVLKLASKGVCNITDPCDALQRLIDFCAGGFEAKNDSKNRKASYE